MNRKVKLASILALQSSFFNFITNNESESDSSDDEEFILILREKKKGREKPVRITEYFEKTIPSFTGKQFKMHFRVTKETFEQLFTFLLPYSNEKQTGRPLGNFRKKLLAILWLLATPDSFRSVGDRFDMSKGNIFDDFVRVVDAPNKVAPRIIKWPNIEERESIKRSFQRFRGLQNVIGAIDGTYVPIRAPSEDAEVYITRKCNYAMTLQCIAIPSLKFTDTFIAYPGSVSDRRIFENSFIFREITRNVNNYCDNSYLIEDKAYPLHCWIIPPFIERRPLTPIQKNFNKIHASTRQVIERSFALLFGRFRRLKFLDMRITDLVPATVNACCVLHNICIDFPDPEIKQYLQEGMEFLLGNVDDEIANEHENANVHENAYGDEIRNRLAQELYENR